MVTSTIEREKEQVKALFDRVEEVEDVAEAIQASQPEQAVRLLRVSQEALGTADPVRAGIAAALLQVSERTVRSWTVEGVLISRKEGRRLLLDPVRLHEVWHLVRELREAGKERDLLSSLWYRLQDQALLDREDMAESLVQMREGETMPALTQAEERAQH